MDKGLSLDDYSVTFPYIAKAEKRAFAEDRLEAGYDESADEVDGKTIHLSAEIFKDDAIVLTETGGEAVLSSLKGSRNVRVLYDTPYLGLWQTYAPDTPFLCIEPWYTLPGRTGTIVDIEKRNVKLYMQPTKNTMCIFFNTECDLCIEELLYIKDNLDIFSCKYNLILISFEDTKKLMDYKNTILSKDKNSSMIFVSDSNFKLIEKYNVSIFPTILIFSKDGVQKSRCNGINIDFLEQLKCNIK